MHAWLTTDTQVDFIRILVHQIEIFQVKRLRQRHDLHLRKYRVEFHSLGVLHDCSVHSMPSTHAPIQ